MAYTPRPKPFFVDPPNPGPLANVWRSVDSMFEQVFQDLRLVAADITTQVAAAAATPTTAITTISSTGTKAARPAPSSTGGLLYLPNNGFSLDRDSGAAWAEFGPIYALTAPVDGSYSWLNQGAAAVDTTNGSIALTMTNADGNLHIRHLAAPATPYTITAAFLYLIIDNNARCGLCWDDGTKVHTFGPQSFSASPNQSFGGLKWTSSSVFSAAYTPVVTSQPAFGFAGVMWLRIADNGTNRICSFSHDGQHWMQFHSVGRTDFLTPSNVGFFIEASNAGSYGSSLTLLSWKQT